MKSHASIVETYRQICMLNYPHSYIQHTLSTYKSYIYACKYIYNFRVKYLHNFQIWMFVIFLELSFFMNFHVSRNKEI